MVKKSEPLFFVVNSSNIDQSILGHLAVSSKFAISLK